MSTGELVATILSVGACVVVMTVLVIRAQKEAKDRTRLFNTGERADAVILELRQTTRRGGSGGYWDVLLEVHPAGRSPFQAWVNFYIAYIDAPRYQPNSVIDAYFDPMDVAKVAAEDSEHGPGLRKGVPKTYA